MDYDLHTAQRKTYIVAPLPDSNQPTSPHRLNTAVQRAQGPTTMRFNGVSYSSLSKMKCENVDYSVSDSVSARRPMSGNMYNTETTVMDRSDSVYISHREFRVSLFYIVRIVYARCIYGRGKLVLGLRMTNRAYFCTIDKCGLAYPGARRGLLLKKKKI